MVETAAHLADPAVQNLALHIFLSVVEQGLRAAVTALAGAKYEAPIPTAMTEAVPATEPGATVRNAPDEVADEPAHRRAARYVWTLLLARIYEVVPLVCPKCGGDMRIIAFINQGPVIYEILGHLGEPTSAPSLAPAQSAA